MENEAYANLKVQFPELEVYMFHGRTQPSFPRPTLPYSAPRRETLVQNDCDLPWSVSVGCPVNQIGKQRPIT